MISVGDVWRQIVSGPGLMDSICNFIIRPPRSDYAIDDLGPDIFRVGDGGEKKFDRTDFELENMRGMNIQCSWFRPLPTTPGARREKRPCVVYCHANCGGRYDALEALYLLEKGFTLFAFDFCGSGMSDGEYISLGFYERQDLAVIVEFLHSKTFEVDGVGLWGRSMGAVTAVMYAAKDPSVRCIVCDSPFASLRILIQDLVVQHGGRAGQLTPTAVVNMIVERIRARIAKRAAFDIDDLDTLKYAALCTVPALLFHGADDDFVSPQQSMRVRDGFQGPCLHELTPGGHNDERDDGMQDFIAAFFRLYMLEKPKGQREQREQRKQKEKERLQQLAQAPAVGTVVSVVAAAASDAAGSGSNGDTHSAPTPSSSRVQTAHAEDSATQKGEEPTPAPRSEVPRYAEPVSGDGDDAPEVSGLWPALTSTDELPPRTQPVAETPPSTQRTTKPAAGAGELGTGQTGPISFTKLRMTAAASDAAGGATEGVPPTATAPALPSQGWDGDDESVLVDRSLPSRVLPK